MVRTGALFMLCAVLPDAVPHRHEDGALRGVRATTSHVLQDMLGTGLREPRHQLHEDGARDAEPRNLLHGLQSRCGRTAPTPTRYASRCGKLARRTFATRSASRCGKIAPAPTR